ncbi:MAG TPA: ATP-binding protein, partial [Polyangiaceae bacterium]|nr:ATP-binding protein [Polyangiaceae bacterium]
MSVKVDLAEFLAAYVAEVDEQLANARAKLLVIEAAARKGERQPREVRDLFRAMHTIKGLSSMVGVEPVVATAHKLETVLRAADRAGGAVSPAAVDVMLRSIRFIEQCVRAAEKGAPVQEPQASLLAALDGITPEDAHTHAVAQIRSTLDPALDQRLDAFERDLLVKGVQEGRRALRVDFAPSAARSAQGLTINTVRERVGALAEIVRVIPISLPEGAIAFAMLLLTSRSDEELGTAAGVAPALVQPIFEATTPAPPSTSLAVTAASDPLPDIESADEGPRRNLLRVDVARVDDAMERLALLIVTRSRLARAIATLTAKGADTRDLAQIAQENARQLRDLRASILQVRMVPLTEILERIPLMVRALMRTSGRQVRLQIDSAGAELDKAVGERIFPAIVHLVRNAVDHGIESPEERERAGKPAEATVLITCPSRSNTRLELSIQDDGRGVDPVAVARRLGRPPPESEGALLDMLCEPGFSTLDEATTTSGRGLGMDIVRRIVVDQLGGELSMKSVAGQGTTFTLHIPLSVAIVDAFIVECCGERFVVPVANVEEILDMQGERLVSPPRPGAAGGTLAVGMMQRRGETLPLYPLATLLGLRFDSAASQRALVIRRAGEPVGFLLDGVRAQQEAVIRPLVDPLVRVNGVSAATDLGD